MNNFLKCIKINIQLWNIQLLHFHERKYNNFKTNLIFPYEKGFEKCCFGKLNVILSKYFSIHLN